MRTRGACHRWAPSSPDKTFRARTLQSVENCTKGTKGFEELQCLRLRGCGAAGHKPATNPASNRRRALPPPRSAMGFRWHHAIICFRASRFAASAAHTYRAQPSTPIQRVHGRRPPFAPCARTEATPTPRPWGGPTRIRDAANFYLTRRKVQNGQEIKKAARRRLLALVSKTG